MVSKLLWYILSFIGVMALGPSLLLIAIFLFKVDVNRYLVQYPIGISLSFALYVMFVCFMFFWLQDYFIVFKPAGETVPLTKTTLINELEKSFNSPADGRRLFEFKKNENRVVITWASSIDYFQVTTAGQRGMKRVVVLTFNEQNHDVFFVMQDKDWQWNLSQGFSDFSLNYSTGIFAEYIDERYPSVAFSKDKGLQVDIKKIKYSSNELWLPIREAVLSSGWTLRGGMMPNVFYRLLFCVPIGLICFGFVYLITMIADNPNKSSAGKTISDPAATQENYQDYAIVQLRKYLSSIPTDNIELQLQGIMDVRKEDLVDYSKKCFVIYANGYFTRKDKKKDFEQKVIIYAKENEIDGLKPF